MSDCISCVQKNQTPWAMVIIVSVKHRWSCVLSIEEDVLESLNTTAEVEAGFSALKERLLDLSVLPRWKKDFLIWVYC